MIDDLHAQVIMRMAATMNELAKETIDRVTADCQALSPASPRNDALLMPLDSCLQKLRTVAYIFRVRQI